MGTGIDTKKVFIFMIVFGGGYLLFRAVRPKELKNISNNGVIDEMKEPEPQSRQAIPIPEMDDTEAGKNTLANDAINALTAYIAAYNNGEPQEELDALNTSLSQEYGMRVFRRRSDAKHVVATLNDQPVMEYPA